MHTVTCCTCKVEFGLSNEFYKTARQMAEQMNWYCPAGHKQHFSSGETEVDRLRRERNQLKQRGAMQQDIINEIAGERDAAQRSAAGYKGVATRMKNRAKAGVCPCCNRTFQNLARHMKSQHTEEDLTNVVELGQPAKRHAK